jgi:flagellar hook-associated protein FlgK
MEVERERSEALLIRQSHNAMQNSNSKKTRQHLNALNHLEEQSKYIAADLERCFASLQEQMKTA